MSRTISASRQEPFPRVIVWPWPQQAALVEVMADRNVLQQLTKHAGASSSAVQESSAWISEKVTRLKLGRSAAGEHGSFKALEFLALGVFGKLFALAGIVHSCAR